MNEYCQLNPAWYFGVPLRTHHTMVVQAAAAPETPLAVQPTLPERFALGR